MVVLFLCTGNTCRSPMAAALFSIASKDQSLDIRSAGTAAWLNTPATSNAVAAAAALGADCVSHASQLATPELLAEADLVVCLAASHAIQAAQFVPAAKLRVLGGGVDDPFGGNLEVYQSCAAQINAALPALLPDLRCPARIIPTNEAHLPAIAELQRVCFPAHPASESKLREKLALNTCHMLTAMVDDNLAGFIAVDEISGEAFVDDLAVFPAYQRRGIASSLLAQAEVNAILRGCGQVHLEVRQSNALARRLYEVRGYHQVGLRKNFYQNPNEPAILMTLEVN